MRTPGAHPPQAFLGGTFDPPHLGHLLLAQDVFEALGPERVWFVPAGRNPLKAHPPVASPEQRRAMLEAALGDDPRFGLLDWELHQAGPSFTIATALHLRERFPGVRLLWIVGQDQLADLPRWHRAEDLAELLEFVYLPRPGCTADPPQRPGWRWHAVAGHPWQVSSTEIRARLRKGRPVDFFLPTGVKAFLEQNRLYA